MVSAGFNESDAIQTGTWPPKLNMASIFESGYQDGDMISHIMKK